MNRRIVLGLVVAVLASAGGWALAQPQAGQGGDKGGSAPGRFAVSPAGNGAVLVDTATGKTWFMHHSVDKSQPSVWVPMQRLEDKDAKDWFAVERDLSQRLVRPQA
jgi:hypothetical protein